MFHLPRGSKVRPVAGNVLMSLVLGALQLRAAAPPVVISEGALQGSRRELAEGVSVCTWARGTAAAMTFTFDDGTRDHAEFVGPLLERHGFRGTFYVVTGTLGNGQGNLGTWAMFQAMDVRGHEVASHCVTHPSLPTLPEGDEKTPETVRFELAKAKADVEAHTGKPCISLAYPFCARSESVDALSREYYLANRNGGLDADHPNWNPSSQPSWMNLTSFTPLFSEARSLKGDAAVLARTKVALGAAIPQKAWAILMTHAVVPFAQIATYGGWQTQSLEWFSELCDWVKAREQSGEYWVATMGEVTRYTQERDAVRLEGVTVRNGGFRIQLEDGLDRRIFNQPLTIAVRIPSDWKAVKIEQPKQPTLSLSLKDKEAHLLLIPIVPGSGEVKIHP